MRRKNLVRVAIIDDKAYWVYNNVFYEANVKDGEINNAEAKPIDASKLSNSQVRMLMDILDSIA